MQPGISRKRQKSLFLFHDSRAIFSAFSEKPRATYSFLQNPSLMSPRVPVVDAHMHVVSLNVARYPLDARAAYEPSPAPIEQALVTLGIHGVDIGVLMQPLAYLWDHSYMLDALSRHGDRFIGMAHLSPDDSFSAATLKSYCSAGVQGLQLHGSILGDSLSERPTLKLCDQAASMGAAVCLQIRPAHIPAVEQLASSLPGVTFIVNHDATADIRLEDWAPILGLSQFENVFLTLSRFATNHTESKAVSGVPSFAARAVDWFGADRLLWGSDFPAALAQDGYQGALDFVRTGIPNLNAADLLSLLGGTAAGIWRLPSGRSESS